MEDYILLRTLSFSRNNSAPKNDRTREVTRESIFERVNMLEVEHFALESEERFCCVRRRRDWASFKDRSFHAMAAISNDSQPLLLCPKERSSFTLFNEVRSFGGCYRFTAQTSLMFTLQARCLQSCRTHRILLIKASCQQNNSSH